MSESPAPVRVALRIPGQWARPEDLVRALPDGYRLTPEAFVLPDGPRVDFGVAPADGQFAEIFRTSCRQPPTADELATVAGYRVNFFLRGAGGSMDAARTMMAAAAAIVWAGGAGVFIDNSALAHGGRNWLALTEDGGPDAVSFAFVAVVRGRAEVWTMGMHVLGLRDVVMKRSDAEAGGFDIVEVIRYLAAADKPVDHGHVIADLDGPQFRVLAADAPADLSRGPMHNPFGRWKLVSMRDIAETN